jgi:hypothetical protein
VSDKQVFGPVNYFPTTNPVGVTNPPLAVYQFDPCGLWLEDRTANNRDLTVVTGAFEFKQDPDTGLFGIEFGSGDHELIMPDEEVLRVAQNELGTDDASLTVEAIVRPTANNGAVFNCAGGGESLTTNYLWSLGEEWNDGGVQKYSSFLEYSNGANAGVSSSAVVKLNTLMYLAMTISADGLTFKWYRDGTLIGTGTATHRAEKNSAGGNVQRVRIGRREDDNYDLKGLLCGLRITNETFADADVGEAWGTISGIATATPIFDIGAARAQEEINFPPLTGEVVRGSAGIERARVIGGANISAEESVEFQSMGGEPGHDPLALDQRGRELEPESLGAVEDIEVTISGPAEFSLWSTDEDGKPHFATPSDYPHPIRAFYYSALGEPFHDPTGHNLTGYARDGQRYTNGVLDAGPVLAPWASEVSSDDRGIRQDFPVTSLIVVARNEVVIFDLDDFDGTVPKLRVFMRFRFGDASNFYMAGRGNYSIRDVKMVNGVLILVQKNTGWENGRLIMIDFKGDTAYNTGHLIGSDNHWRWNGTIADRNTVKYTTSGVSPSLRHNCEQIWSVSAVLDDDQTLYVAIVGDDTSPTIFKSYAGTGLAVSSWVTTVTGPEVGDSDSGEDYRMVLFDRLGIFWFSIDNRLYRNVVQYKEGAVVADLANNWQPDALYKGVELPYQILGLAEAQNFIFCATSNGIYVVHRGSLDFWLAYTWPGGGGRGVANSPGAGEILVGGPNSISRKRLSSLALAQANFIAVMQDMPQQGVQAAMLVRTSDDYLVSSQVWPTVLVEANAAFHVLIT